MNNIVVLYIFDGNDDVIVKDWIRTEGGIHTVDDYGNTLLYYAVRQQQLSLLLRIGDFIDE